MSQNARKGVSGVFGAVYWEEPSNGFAREMSVEVIHPDGTRTFVVLDIARMSEPQPAASVPPTPREREP